MNWQNILDTLHLFPAEGFKIGLTLLLSFLIGLEREETKNENTSQYIFGGVRTFPLIGLLGYTFAKISGENLIPVAIGFATIGAFLIFSYRNKLVLNKNAGFASEITGLFTYMIGVLVFKEEFWIATTLVVVGLIVLEMKNFLEGLAKKIPPVEIYTFTKFLLLSPVILPVLPNQSFTEFNLNPFKTWLVVIAISGISYTAYILAKFVGQKGGVIVSAILGGAYSSTITTLVLARRTQHENLPRLFSGGILMASGMMYIRLLILLSLLNLEVALHLLPAFLPLGFLGILGGWLWSRGERKSVEKTTEQAPRNPLEIKSAIFFAFLFVLMAVLTRLAHEHLGNSGIYGLSFLSGLSDVDPFIMSISDGAGQATPLTVVSTAILIATMSNNILKGIYTYAVAKGAARVQGTLFLFALAALGVVAIAFV